MPRTSPRSPSAAYTRTLGRHGAPAAAPAAAAPGQVTAGSAPGAGSLTAARRRVTFEEGDECYALRPPLASAGLATRVAESTGELGVLYTGMVWVETIGEDGRGRRKRWLPSSQLHDSPVTASGRKRTTGYGRLSPGQPAPTPDAARPEPTSEAAPAAQAEAAPGAATEVAPDPAALRLALDDAAHNLRQIGLALDGSPAPIGAADSAQDCAHRADALYQTLTLLAARIEPYAESPAAAARRVRATADAVAGRQGLKGPNAR